MFLAGYKRIGVGRNSVQLKDVEKIVKLSVDVPTHSEAIALQSHAYKKATIRFEKFKSDIIIIYRIAGKIDG